MPTDYGRFMGSMADAVQGPVNAFYQAQDRQRVLGQRDKMLAQDDEEDARWLQAIQTGDWPSAFKIDPQATQAFQMHKQREAMSGLGDISVTAKPMDEKAVYDRGMDERQFAATQQDRQRNYNLDVAAERRMSRTPKSEGISFAEYASMSPEQRALHDRFKGNKGGGAAGPETEGDKKATVLYGSLFAAEKDIAALENGMDTSSTKNAVLGAIPLDADLAKQYQDQDFKKYDAAAQRWSANLLYLKSGAQAGADEVRTTSIQYFPQPGDSQEVKEQKAMARRTEMEAIAGAYPWLASRFDVGSIRPDKANKASRESAPKAVRWEDLP